MGREGLKYQEGREGLKCQDKDWGREGLKCHVRKRRTEVSSGEGKDRSVKWREEKD